MNYKQTHNIINLIAILIIMIGGYLLLVEKVPITEIPKLKLRDMLFRITRFDVIKNIRPLPPELNDIVLISVDEDSYQHLSKKWPWGRDVFADFLYKLKGFKPKIVAMDFAFFGKTPDNETADTSFAQALKDSGNVLLACAYGKQLIYIEPEKMFRENALGYGLIGAVRDSDNAIRKIRPFALILSKDKSADFSFELKASAFYLGVLLQDIEHQTNNIKLKFPYDPRYGERLINIPLDEEGSMNINFFQKYEDLKIIPFWKVYQGDISKNDIKDKLVIVSQTGELFHDQHPSPYGLQPGGAIIANAIGTILSKNFIKEVPKNVYYIVLFLVCFFTAITALRYTVFMGALFAGFEIIFLFSLSIYSFINNTFFDVFDFVVLTVLIYLTVTFYRYICLVLESANLRIMAITDTLTGLNTHRYFRFLILNDLEKNLKKKNYQATLIIISIDQLKEINSKYGFEIGDKLIKLAVEDIRAIFKHNSILTNLGGGDIAVYLKKVSVGEAIGLCEKLQEEIARNIFKAPKEEMKITLTCGLAAYKKDYCSNVDDLILCAKVALKRIKGVEGEYNHISIFNPKFDSIKRDSYYAIKDISFDNSDFGFLARDLEERNIELEDLIRKFSEAKIELESAHFDTLRSLVIALEEKDPYTAGHSERVCSYAIKLAQRAGFPQEDMNILKEAALLHDIGKISIPTNILNKESQLEDYERDVMKTHPLFSVRILSSSKYFVKHLPMILHHHEQYDGSGYPHRLSGNSIPLGAQIIAIADTYDAMTTGRPYKKIAATKHDAIEEFKKFSGKQFNPKLVKFFLEMLEEEKPLQ